MHREGDAFPNILGISQRPYVAEAMFGIGPMQIHFNRKTNNAVNQNHQFREFVKKGNGARIDTTCSLSIESKSFELSKYVSAVWALDVTEAIYLNYSGPAEVIHNLNPLSPLKSGFIPAYYEHFCAESALEWTVERVRGRLSQVSSRPIT